MKTALTSVATALTLSAAIAAAPLPDCADTLKIMERVADWQLENPSKHHQLDWTQGAGYAGFMALGDITINAKYREAMRAIGEKHQWKFARDSYHADDHTVGQMYAEMYRLYGDPRMIAPQMACFDRIIADPDTDPADKIKGARMKPMRWWWCDALFMAPPALADLTALTGDEKYLNFAIAEWKASSEKLYHPEDRLYFRDSRFYPENKLEKNGRRIHWSRGNGWVFGGLVRVLQVMPLNHPERPWFEKQFKEMAGELVKIQPEDGAWRASLYDTGAFSLPEASGTGFFVYGLAWGVNQGLLGDVPGAREAALKGWAALCSFVTEEGKLTHVQVIAADPTASVKPTSTEIYGVGAFLCAGSEIYRMRLLGDKPSATIKVKNNAKEFKGRAFMPVKLKQITDKLPTFIENGAIMDGSAARWIPFQLPPNGEDEMLILVDMLPGGEYSFKAVAGLDKAAIPQSPVRTFARFVPERLDDFAFENDRTIFRIYGPALEKTDGLTKMGAGVDMWAKNIREPAIDKMYASKKYHSPSLGYGIDAYKVGTGPGCGGTFPWVNGKPVNMGAFKTWKIIANGPIISKMAFTYESPDGSLSGTSTYTQMLGADGYLVETTVKAKDPATVITPSVGLSLFHSTHEVEEPGMILCLQNGDGKDGDGMSFGAAALVFNGKATPVRDASGLYLQGAPETGTATMRAFVGAAWSKGIDYPELKGFEETMRARSKSKYGVINAVIEKTITVD